MLPYYESHHHCQELGFNGSNLAQKRRKEILTKCPEMNADSIQAQGDDRYLIQSATEPSCTYSMELNKLSCDCPDWPRVQLCKHVASTAHFFGRGDQLNQLLESIDSDPAPAPLEPLEQPVDSDGSSDAHSNVAAEILGNVINVSQEFLSDGAPSSPGTVRSLHMVEAHLSTVVQTSRSSESPLPDKEEIPPNQHSWTETAQRMGALRWKRPRTDTKLPATQCIGELNCKQRHLQNPDPYSGGLNSGRNAPLDMQSAAQNAEARARTAAEPALSQPRKRGCKHLGSPVPSLPPSASLQPPLSSAPPPSNLTWYAAQPMAHAGTYSYAAAASAPAGPSQGFGAHHVGPVWYPMPTTYPSRMYAQVPYTYWPYGHFHSQLPPS
ncbi:hypothetical protein EI94DRAFT_1819669 [Lactarius quietus]|nr:hypothetical protein EI94DRAFT_1819669 [Lactarius quietus]